MSATTPRVCCLGACLLLYLGLFAAASVSLFVFARSLPDWLAILYGLLWGVTGALPPAVALCVWARRAETRAQEVEAEGRACLAAEPVPWVVVTQPAAP